MTEHELAERYAQRLIDLGCGDQSDFDNYVNDTPLEKLKEDLIDALEEELRDYRTKYSIAYGENLKLRKKVLA